MSNNLEIFRQVGVALAISAQKSTLTDEEAIKVKNLQKVWKVDETVSVGDRRQYDGKLYKCCQAHTTQADWTPDVYNTGWELIDKII